MRRIIARRRSVSSLYAVMLKKGLPNPLQPESDEESGGAKPTPPAEPKGPAVDLDGIEARVIALPAPSQIYTALEPATGGSFYALAAAPNTGPESLSKNSGVKKPLIVHQFEANFHFHTQVQPVYSSMAETCGGFTTVCLAA